MNVNLPLYYYSSPCNEYLNERFITVLVIGKYWIFIYFDIKLTNCYCFALFQIVVKLKRLNQHTWVCYLNLILPILQKVLTLGYKFQISLNQCYAQHTKSLVPFQVKLNQSQIERFYYCLFLNNHYTDYFSSST